MSLCGPIWWRLRSPDGARFWEFESPDWDFDFRRNTASQADVDVSGCGRFDEFEAWCDWLEVWCGEGASAEMVERYVYTGRNPGSDAVRISGVGFLELAEQKRRHLVTQQLTGTAGQVWYETIGIANTPALTGIDPVVSSGGTVVTLDVNQGDSLSGTINTLLTYVTYTQHRGATYGWLEGSEPQMGRALTPDWVVDGGGCFDVGELDAGAVANDLLFAYGTTLESTYRWQDQGGNCVLQSGRLEFPEVTTQAGIEALANEWGPRLAAPEPVLDSVQLDKNCTTIDDLMPGKWHRDQATAHAGYAHNLAVATVSGTYGCVEEIEAGFDQGDNAVRRRIR